MRQCGITETMTQVGSKFLFILFVAFVAICCSAQPCSSRGLVLQCHTLSDDGGDTRGVVPGSGAIYGIMMWYTCGLGQ